MVAANAHPNIFNVEQEVWLGDAVADLIVDENPPIKDPALSQHLQDIVDKLAKNLPEPHVPFKVMLVESTAVNGWSIAGGRIFITRKLASAVASDDELAAVLGHEMGHIASHQFAFETTAEMERLLHVSQVGDEKDVYSKFQQLLDAEMKDKHPPKDKEDERQDEADQIGVYLAAAAGYDPHAGPQFFDRAYFVDDKTGNRFTDLLGLTKPNEKRLAEMKKLVETLPAGCGGHGASPEEQAAFEQWQKLVREDQEEKTQEVVAGATQVRLTPPLKIELERVRFSPDGKWVLAQDESSIYVLSRDPWKVKFRVDADQAQWAWFSPDSSQLTFTTPGLHTEEWNVASGKLIDAHEPLARHPCLQTRLSPDGRTIVCVSFDEPSWRLGLSLLDATSGDVLWEKKDFFTPSFGFLRTVAVQYVFGIPSETLWSSFSPDGNFLIIGPGSQKVAFDLRTRQPVEMGGGFMHTVDGPFAFLDNDRVAGECLESAKDSGIFSFPSGKRVQSLKFDLSDIEALSNTGGKAHVLTRSIYGMVVSRNDQPKTKDAFESESRVEERIAVADLETGTYLFGSRSEALDMWGNYAVTEAGDGRLALIQFDAAGRPVHPQVVTLPESRLGSLATVEASPDGQLIALSTDDRGGVWNLKTGALVVLLKPFLHASWLNDTTMVADYQKADTLEREAVSFDVATHEFRVLEAKLIHEPKLVLQMDAENLTEWDSGKGDERTLTIRSLKDASVMWKKTFTDGYPQWTESLSKQDLLFSYPFQTDTAKRMIKEDAHLAEEAAAIKKKDDGRVVEVVDVASGKTLATMALELPMDYYGVGGLNRVGDQMYVTGTDNRTLAYSLKDGKKLWETFGWMLATDPVSGRVCLWNRKDEVIVFDAQGNKLLDTQIGQPVRFGAFEQNGSKLVLLRSDQTVVTLSLHGAEMETAKAAAH